jgi:uncharacterized protein GlcG (DUF336 family)
VPLFKNGVPVGGIGVAGDQSDRRVREGLPFDRKVLPRPDEPVGSPANLYDGSEEHDVDEQVALAGAAGYPTPRDIQATNIFVAGLRFPFLADTAKTDNASRSLDNIISSGDGRLVMATAKNNGIGHLIGAPYSVQPNEQVRSSPGSPFPAATIAGIVGEFKNTSSRTPGHGLIGSDDVFTTDKGAHKAGDPLPDKDRLTKNDVKKIITQAVNEALHTRAGIRRPIGVPVRVHVAVVDRDGTLLGVFRMQDGTNFSYDVAVQKARTAAFFSDNKHAFSARTIGFLSQQFFPAGIDDGLTGPLFHLQNGLSLGGDFGITNRTQATVGSATNPLPNGITIFPGGAPLYKNGQFVGAVGISGDGVDEDDEIAFAGTKHFQAPEAIRADHLPEDKIVNFLTNKVQQMDSLYDMVIPGSSTKEKEDTAAEVLARLPLGLDDVQLPFQKFPRNPEL